MVLDDVSIADFWEKRKKQNAGFSPFSPPIYEHFVNSVSIYRKSLGKSRIL
jgi:hypothetical protein